MLSVKTVNSTSEINTCKIDVFYDPLYDEYIKQLSNLQIEEVDYTVVGVDSLNFFTLCK